MNQNNRVNPNKAISANSTGIKVFYTDSFKSHSIYYEEKSPLKDLQVSGNRHHNTSYQKVIITNSENAISQKTLYNHAMYGLKGYSEQEVSKMPFVQKMKIKEMYDQTQFQLNIWKQQLVHNKIGSFLTTLFHKSSFAKDLATYPKSVSTWDKSAMTLRELGIRKEMVEQKLIELGILPNNYYQLTA